MSTQQLISQLTDIVGHTHIITDAVKNEAYRSGYRFGTGNAIAVVRPATLLEFWNVLKACVAHDVIVINQAANTGLTGGSTPSGNDYDRDIVIINTMLMKNIQLINDAEQVVCFPGSTLNELENLLKPHEREPHSVIGSSCIGASVIGGICNNSGGALVQRGPAYTEMALFAQLNENGELELKNHLGIDLGETPEEILTNLQGHHYQRKDIQRDCGKGHDHHYCNHVRKVDEIQTLNDIRRHMLANFKVLPISGEYIHRDAFDVAARYGKDTFWVIKKFGTHWLPKLFALKANVDRIAKKFSFLPHHLSDKFMQLLSKVMPEHLPKSLWAYRDKYEHHLIVKMGGKGVQEAREFLKTYFSDATKGGYFECNAEETQAAMLHRFAVASAAIRYRAIHEKEVEEIVALDVALRRNDNEWFEVLPPEIDNKISHKLYYGHFMCHVFHQDYIVKKGYDCEALEHDMLKLLDQRGAQYPAEHNVGHLYEAKPELRKFYKVLDPTNSFNPGIGKTTKKKHWVE